MKPDDLLSFSLFWLVLRCEQDGQFASHALRPIVRPIRRAMRFSACSLRLLRSRRPIKRPMKRLRGVYQTQRSPIQTRRRRVCSGRGTPLGHSLWRLMPASHLLQLSALSECMALAHLAPRVYISAISREITFLLKFIQPPLIERMSDG